MSTRARALGTGWGRVTAAAAGIAVLGAASLAGDRTTERLLQATAAMQSADYAGAIRILEPAGEHLADDARASRMLSLAHLKLRQSEAARTSALKALSLDPATPQPLIYLGIAAVQSGDRDAAFEWFRKARATGKLDMTQLDAEADLEPLRSDARYLALMPRPEDFRNPFVEPVNVIREWDGESANDQFGWIARVIGDVDGDGIPDFVTSAPTKDVHGPNAGRVYVYSSGTGKLLWSVDGAPGDQLGSGIEAAGDVDGDGIPDVIASAPAIDTAYVYSGRDGHVLLTLHGEAKGDGFGAHVASVGDLDGDGHSDVIVGAPGSNAGGKGAGRAYVYSGKDGHVLQTLTGERAGDGYGSTVAGYSAGTQHFVVVGAPGAGSAKHGRVYVHRDGSTHPSFVIDADPSGIALGAMFVAVLGDVDGDGVPDVFASDWSDAGKGPRTGKIYVYSGRTGRRLYALAGETSGEGFGTTHSTAGDVNGDGRADLIVGSWQYSAAAQSGGRAYLFEGSTGRLLRTYTCRTPGDTFGFDAVGLGAFDPNGQAELLITSGWSAVRGFHSGRIFLISSGVPGGAVAKR